RVRRGNANLMAVLGQPVALHDRAIDVAADADQFDIAEVAERRGTGAAGDDIGKLDAQRAVEVATNVELVVVAGIAGHGRGAAERDFEERGRSEGIADIRIEARDVEAAGDIGIAGRFAGGEQTIEIEVAQNVDVAPQNAVLDEA